MSEKSGTKFDRMTTWSKSKQDGSCSEFLLFRNTKNNKHSLDSFLNCVKLISKTQSVEQLSGVTAIASLFVWHCSWTAHIVRKIELIERNQKGCFAALVNSVLMTGKIRQFSVTSAGSYPLRTRYVCQGRGDRHSVPQLSSSLSLCQSS